MSICFFLSPYSIQSHKQIFTLGYGRNKLNSSWYSFIPLERKKGKSAMQREILPTYNGMSVHHHPYTRHYRKCYTICIHIRLTESRQQAYATYELRLTRKGYVS
jgi:hypothetical protein